MGLEVAAAIDRVAVARPRGRAGHVGALVAVGVVIILVELFFRGLDHGTHLLVGLVLVAGSALLFGPGPAVSGLMLGAGASVAVGGAVVNGLLGSPNTYVQVTLYLLAGGAVVGLAALAFRARTPQAPVATAPLATSLVEPLTEREVEILRMAASGISVEEIAERMCLSSNTVKTHLTHVYAKLGVRGRSDAVRAALHFGYLEPADICPHRFPYGERGSPVAVSRDHRHR